MSGSAKDVARGFYESYNERDLTSTFERYISTELINHALGGTFDRESWLAADIQFAEAFPDLRAEVLDQVAEGDIVATRWRLTGTQEKEFFGTPSKGVQATLTATSFDRVEGSQLVEHWVDMDLTGFLQQLAGPAA